MRPTAIPAKGAASFEELRPACQVLILHDDFPAYSHAVEACRRVMERFANELDFSIKCWSLIELADPHCARHAARSAAAADIILLSVHGAPLPPETVHWLDSALANRIRPQGVLALVMPPVVTDLTARDKLASRLQQLTGQAGMDFLSLLPGEDPLVITPHRTSPALRHPRA